MTARKFLALPLAFVGGVILASFAACTEANDSHCGVKGGDAYCQEKTGKAEGEVFCTNNCGGDYDADGCLVASEAPADGCWLCDGAGSENCGDIGDGDSTDTMDTTADETADSSMTDSTDTMGTTTETGPECTMSSDCTNPAEPLCDAEACVACGDAVAATCADYPDTQVCDEGSGACVECSEADVSHCSPEAPACEGGVCVPCTEHEECPDSACNMSTGACMPTDRVWWVNQTVGASGDGSEMSPKKTIGEILTLIGDGQEGTIYLATPNAHQEYCPVFSGRTVAVLGKAANGTMTWNGAPPIDANQDSTVILHDLKVSAGSDFGVRCNGCDLWVSDSSIVNNSKGGIVVQGGGLANLVNSFVGGIPLSAPAVSVEVGEANVLSSTLAGGSSNSPALTCQVGTIVTVRNSLLVSLQIGAEVNCVAATISNSALEVSLPGNTMLGVMPDDSWFVGYNGGDFHLTPDAPMGISTAATWQTGDPKTDIDGDPRPAVDGTMDYAGADVAN